MKGKDFRLKTGEVKVIRALISFDKEEYTCENEFDTMECNDIIKHFKNAYNQIDGIINNLEYQKENNEKTK